MNDNLDSRINKGKEIADQLLMGKVKSFEKYAIKTCTINQRLETRIEQIGKCISAYISTLEGEVAKLIVQKIFNVSDYEKIRIFKIAKGISLKYEEYENSKDKRKHYILQRPDVKEVEFDSAMVIAKYI